MVVTFENLPQKVFEISQQNEEILKQLKRLTSPQPAEQHFNIDEVCNYLPQRPARATVYGMVHAKKIPCHKQGKRLYFLKSEIDSWLLQGRKKTLEETASEANAYLMKSKGGVRNG